MAHNVKNKFHPLSCVLYALNLSSYHFLRSRDIRLSQHFTLDTHDNRLPVTVIGRKTGCYNTSNNLLLFNITLMPRFIVLILKMINKVRIN